MLSILTKKKQNQDQSETRKLWCMMGVFITLTLTVLIVSKLRWNFTWKLPSNSEVYMEIQRAENSQNNFAKEEDGATYSTKGGN